MQEAAELLVKAQAAEAGHFAIARPAHPDASPNGSSGGASHGGPRDIPPPPVFLQRTPHSVLLTHNTPLSLRGGKRAVTYAAYCKNFGAGVALSINKTATEYPGMWVCVCVGQCDTVCRH